MYFGGISRRVVVYGCTFDAYWPTVSTSNVGDSGIQSYGGIHTLIAEDNFMSDVESGIYVDTYARNSQVQSGFSDIRPNYFNLFKNNTITNSELSLIHI